MRRDPILGGIVSDTETTRARPVLGAHIPMRSLVQLLAVAEHLSFRRAAIALGTSQSCVSARVQHLEQDLGIRIFERHPRGVRLTKAGRQFVAQVSVGIDHLDHAVKTAGMLASGRHGNLRVGLYSPISVGFVADLLALHRERYRDVQIEFVETSARDMIRRVRKGSLDLAFVGNRPPVEDCHSRDVWNEDIVVALPLSHKLAGAGSIRWQDIADAGFIVTSDGAGPQVYDHVVQRLAERGHIARVRRLEVGRDTLLQMVASNEGLTLVTHVFADIPTPGVTFCPIVDEPDVARFSAIWSPHNSDRALRSFLDLAFRAGRSRRSP